MIKQIKNIEELKDKVIEKIEIFDNELWIKFKATTDTICGVDRRSFVVFESVAGDGYTLIEISEDDVCPTNPNLFNMNIIAEEEYKNRVKCEEEQYETSKKAQEQKLYLILKEKYEKKS